MRFSQKQARRNRKEISFERIPLILMADDDPEDVMLIREAIEESTHEHQFSFVSDGEELLKALNTAVEAPDGRLPDLILLDLNMPRKDGREALKTIKKDPGLRIIPVIVLSTSDDPEDIHRAYELGANSFISKPSEFNTLIEVMDTVMKYWLEVVKLP